MSSNVLNVVTKEELGTTLEFNGKESGKLNVTLNGITNATLDTPSKSIHIYHTGSVEPIKVDLTSLLPTIAADVFLKNVSRSGNNLVFTIGEQGNTNRDTTLEVGVSDFLTAVSDGQTMIGNGTSNNKLTVRIAGGTDNLLQKTASGLTVSKNAVLGLVKDPTNTIQLANLAGTTLGTIMRP